jgi:hypothetical protein
LESFGKVGAGCRCGHEEKVTPRILDMSNPKPQENLSKLRALHKRVEEALK